MGAGDSSAINASSMADCVKRADNDFFGVFEKPRPRAQKRLKRGE